MKWNLLFIAVLVIVSCKDRTKNSSDKRFVLNAHIRNIGTSQVNISYYSGNKNVYDSITPKNDSFSFSGTVSEPVLFSLTFPGNKLAQFFSFNNNIEISGDTAAIGNLEIKSCKEQDQYKKYQDELAPFDEREQQLIAVYTMEQNKHNQKGMDSLSLQFDTLHLKKKELLVKFINQYPQSPVSSFLAYDNFGQFRGEQEKTAIYNTLKRSAENSYYIDKVKKKLDAFLSIQIGKIAPDFTQTDMNGKSYSLSSLRGKYVLLDFWAGWCVPCRKENPYLVQSYKKYKNKNFEIIGISLDGDKNLWVNSIKADKLQWINVSELNFFDNKVAKLYGVTTIPANFLLDPDGRIIDKALRREQLEKKLSEIFK